MGNKRIISIRNINISILIIAIIVSVFYFSTGVDAGIETLNITNQEKTVEVGKSFQIKLNGLNASKIKWSSSNKKIATVSKKGIVKGIKAGNAKITGKYKTLKFVIKVTVGSSQNDPLPEDSTTTPKNLNLLVYTDKNIDICVTKIETGNEESEVYFSMKNKTSCTRLIMFDPINVNGKNSHSYGGERVAFSGYSCDIRQYFYQKIDKIDRIQAKVVMYDESSGDQETIRFEFTYEAK